ncbi:MAG: substrate-binding domain-containing protein [Acidimicrobiales bacterium]
MRQTKRTNCLGGCAPDARLRRAPHRRPARWRSLGRRRLPIDNKLSIREPQAPRRLSWIAALFVALSLIAAGCGDDDDDGGSGDGGEDVSGTINVSGSSTVEPITTRVSELFEDVAADVVVNVDGPGTGDGFVLFCDGETDISDASRAISDEEIQTCADNGIEYIELKVAIDGLSVLTNPANEDVECLNFADLYALSGPESQGFDNWSDAQELAADLGSDTTFPDAPLDISAPGEESGTYDSYIEIVFGDFAEARGQEEQTRPDYQSSGDDNIIIQGIEGSDTSFGWVGYAFAQGAGDGVKPINIAEEPGGECVAPDPETIASGEYPISRPLFVYVNVEKLEASPALEAFVDFYLSDDGLSAVDEVGYVALDDDALAETLDAWETKETGTREN